jgi:hypothetical protein
MMPMLHATLPHSSARRRLAALLLASLTAAAGCQKIQEMTEKKDEPQAPSAPPAGTTLPGASAPPAGPPATPATVKTPQQVIDEFLAKKPTQLTNADLEELARQPEGLDKITTLDLSNSRVGDAGLTHLPKFPNVDYLDLSGTAVTNAGLTPVAELGKLTTIALDRTQNLDETGYAPLAKCKD